MDEPEGHYAKENSQTEEDLLNGITYTRNQKRKLSKTSRNSEQDGGCQRLKGKEKWECLMGMEFGFGIMGKFWRHMMVTIVQLCKGA